jgi:signal transduction histidine kinase
VKRPGDPRWQRLTLRMRMVLAAAVAVIVVVAVGGALTLFLARSFLIEAADELGEARADQLAEQAIDRSLPAQVEKADDVEAAVQVVRGGKVVSATVNATTRASIPLDEMSPGTENVIAFESLDINDDGPFRVLARGIQTPDGPTTIFVVVDVEDINEVTGALATAETVSLVVLTVALGIVLWVIVGRTLTPVEAIRRRAEDITGSRLQQRVPEPARKDEIGRLARTINAMLARLEDSSKRQERFVADAAHELRTPLASLRARLEQEMDRTPSSRHDELLTELWELAGRMDLLVEQLLLLARSDAGTVRMQAEPVDLEDLVDDVITTCRFSAGRVRKARFEPAQVLGEPALLELVVRNLLDNAVRHSTSAVEVSLFAQDGRALLVVEDDGPGIAPSHRSEVFVRFVRLDDARSRKPGGAGLGLAIVKEIAAVHGGTVEAGDSSRLGGASLQVSLPMESQARPGGRAQASSESRAGVETGAAASRARRRGTS